MTIIVTGGAGFIGSNFIFHMLNKYPDYRIVCLDCLTYAGNLSTLEPVMDNPNFRFVKESITDREAVYRLFEEEKPDIVVNATGSVPVVPPIKGLKENIAAGHVDTIFEMIQKVKAGEYPDDFCKDKKVVVVGGGSVGLDVVEYFAPRGAKCTIVDMLPQIGMLADPITKCSMRETHDQYGVKEYVNTALQEVKENAFTVKLPDGTIEDLNFDLGFNCLGMRANNPILAQLEEAFDNTDTFIYPIGDSVRARRIMEGTMEGRAILNVLEARGFLELAPLE